MTINASRSFGVDLDQAADLGAPQLAVGNVMADHAGNTPRYSAALVVEMRCRSGNTEVGLRPGMTGILYSAWEELHLTERVSQSLALPTQSDRRPAHGTLWRATEARLAD